MKHLKKFIIACLLWTTVTAHAGLGLEVISITNISPFQSTKDVVTPNSASGGRINRIATSQTNSNLFYAASEYGGLFVSGDRGDTWSKISNYLHSVTWDVAIDPTDENRVIATSFYDGRIPSRAGIAVRVSNTGRWTYPTTVLPASGFDCETVRIEQPSAFGIAFDASSPTNVYVGTNCGLAISTDSGSTWRHVDPTPADQANNIWDVIVHHDGIIDVCGDDGHLRSEDGGASFTTAPIGNIPLPSGQCTLAVSPDESYVLFATVGLQIYESDDGGQNWDKSYTNPFPQGRIPFVKTNQRLGNGYDLWFGDISLGRTSCTTPASPSPGGPQRCLAAITGSFTRAAGGHDDVGDLAFDSATATDACPVVFASDGGVYVNTTRTSPACHTPAWEQPTKTTRALWLWDMAGSGNDRQYLYFGTQDNGGPFGTQDAAATNPNWSSNFCCDMFDVEGQLAESWFSLCCSGGGRTTRMFRSTRDMVNPVEISYPPGNLIAGQDMDTPRQDMDTLQISKTGYAMLTNMGAFFSTRIDSSVSWSPLGTPPTNGLCSIQASREFSSVPGGQDAFIGKQGQRCANSIPNSLLKYVGTGASGTWIQVNPPAPSGGFGVFAVNPKDVNHIVASFLPSVGSPFMVLTRDGGTTWNNLTNLDSLMTANGGIRYQVQRGLIGNGRIGPYPQPSMLAFDKQDPRNIVAGGMDVGVVFLSRAGGTDSSWLPLTNSRFSNIRITRPKFAHINSNSRFGGMDIYVGTRGNGVFKIQFSQISQPFLN